MRITWMQTPIDEDIEFILWILNSDMGNWWKEPFFWHYPEIDRAHYETLNAAERDEYITKKMHEIAPTRRNEISTRVNECNSFWGQNTEKLNAAFENAFGRDVSNILNNITGRIGLDPICPRYIDRTAFDTFYKFSLERMKLTAVHEMTHFLWFHIWQEKYHDNPNDYESPHIKWLLSELVVDVIVRNSALADFFDNLDDEREIGYPYFLDMEISGRPILQTLADMYKSTGDITAFMETAYKYVQENEAQLRTKIAAAEK